MEAATKVMVTGHRSLPAEAWNWVASDIARCLSKLADQRGDLIAIQGLALGADMLFAEIALGQDRPVWSFEPFSGQASRWNPTEQARHERIKAASARTVTLADDPGGDRGLAVRLLHARNDRMLGEADIVMAVLDARQTGGSRSAVLKALKRELPVLRLNPAARTTGWIKELR